MVKNRKIHASSKQHKTLALISDIHYTKNYPVKRLKQIYENLKQHQPDYICMAGDLLDEGNILTDKECHIFFLNWIEQIAKIAPVVISIGNHDVGIKGYQWSYYDPKETIKELSSIPNVSLLDNNSISIDDICFLGYTLPFAYYNEKPHEQVKPYISDIDQKLRSHLKEDCYQILLCHTPIYVTHPEVCQTEVLKSVQLVLCGHMHNGIIPLPIKGKYGLISPCKKFFPKYAWGSFQLKKTQYVISGGIIAFSKVSPIIFHPMNYIYPSYIEYISI